MDEVDHRLADLLKASGNGVRLNVLKLLQEKALSVTKLANKLARSVNSISHHLGTLRAHGLVEADTVGQSRIYKLKRPDIVEAIFALLPLIQRDDD